MAGRQVVRGPVDAQLVEVGRDHVRASGPPPISASAVSNENDPVPWPMSMTTPESHARLANS